MWLVLSSVALAQTAPTVAPCSVLEPRFTVDGKSVAAGKMFALKVGEKTLLLTAHHLLGPNGGLPAQLGPDEVVAKVASVGLTDASDGKTSCGRSVKALKVAGAAPMAGGDASTDLAVFVPAPVETKDRLTTTALAPLALAAAAPKVGDPVWLASRVQGREGMAWAAKVVEVQANALYLEYADKELDLTATSGAPILDAKGAVVGLNLGGGKMDDGALIGAASPVGALKSRVETAAATP